MYEFFTKYLDILKILKKAEDPGIKKHLKDTLIYMRSKMFKSAEHLDSILEKNFEDVTPQDLMDVAYQLSDPENDRSWWHGFIVHSKHVAIYAHGTYGGVNSPCVDLDLNGFTKNIKVMKPGFSSHDADDIHTYNYRDVGVFEKGNRDSIIKTVLNLYRFYKLNDILPDNVYTYPKTWNSDKDNFWEGLALWLVKCNHFEDIESINWDYDRLTEETRNLMKSSVASGKFNLKLSA